MRKRIAMEKQVFYHYLKIDLEQFATFEENWTADQYVSLGTHEVSFSFDRKNSVLSCQENVVFVHGDKPLLKCVQSSYFVIREDSVEAMKKEDGSIVFEPFLLIQLASLNYGTMRGTIFAKTKGTKFENFILPPTLFNDYIRESFIVGGEG